MHLRHVVHGQQDVLRGDLMQVRGQRLRHRQRPLLVCTQRNHIAVVQSKRILTTWVAGGFLGFQHFFL